MNAATRKLINIYLWVKILESAAMGWHFSTYVLFLLERGLTPAQTTQVNMAYMMGSFVFDLPTGAMGDVLGHVPVYLSGMLILAVGFFTYGLGTTYMWFFVCEALSAVGSALMSNALESLLTNEVGIEISKEVQAREGIYTKFATIPTALCGSFVGAAFGLQYPWFFSGITMFVGFVLGAVTLKKYHDARKSAVTALNNVFPEFILSLKTGTMLVFSKKPLVYAMFISLTLSAATQAVNMYWAPIFKAQAGSTWWMGFLWVGIALVSAFGSWISKKLKGTLKVIGLILLSIAVPLFLTNVFPQLIWITCALFLLHEVGRGAMPAVMFGYTNNFISKDVRNTANSAMGSLDMFAKWFGLWVAGVLTGYFSLLQIWQICGLVLLVVGLFTVALELRARALVVSREYIES